MNRMRPESVLLTGIVHHNSDLQRCVLSGKGLFLCPDL